MAWLSDLRGYIDNGLITINTRGTDTDFVDKQGRKGCPSRGRAEPPHQEDGDGSGQGQAPSSVEVADGAAPLAGEARQPLRPKLQALKGSSVDQV